MVSRKVKEFFSDGMKKNLLHVGINIGLNDDYVKKLIHICKAYELYLNVGLICSRFRYLFLFVCSNVMCITFHPNPLH